MSEPADPDVRRFDGPASLDGLVDALDRLVANGVAISGDVLIGIAGIDLIRLDLRALLIGVGDSRSDGGP